MGKILTSIPRARWEHVAETVVIDATAGAAPFWCWFPVQSWLRGPRQLQERVQERDH
jgi:hypothetical protein